MVGNDIIDVRLAKKGPDWKGARYSKKLFTSKEQSYIGDSNQNNLMIWQLWSMKESAYKLYLQLGNTRFYNPKRLECHLEGSDATVSIGDFSCKVMTQHTSDYIFSEAKLSDKIAISDVVRLESDRYNGQSLGLKTRFFRKLSGLMGIDEQSLKILKNENGVPSLYTYEKRLPFHFSLSHHGRYGMYSIIL